MVVSAVRCFAPRRYRGMKISIRRSLAITVGASILFLSGALNIRSLTQAPPAAAASAARAPVKDQPTPYAHDLQRLSEILGALHFLRGICNSSEGQKWRKEAQALIDAEAPSGKRHDEMVASFNRGYLSFQTYRICTSVVDVVVRRYLEEGAKIARDITARYAN